LARSSCVDANDARTLLVLVLVLVLFASLSASAAT
jgi:hypothetical protein